MPPVFTSQKGPQQSGQLLRCSQKAICRVLMRSVSQGPDHLNECLQLCHPHLAMSLCMQVSAVSWESWQSLLAMALRGRSISISPGQASAKTCVNPCWVLNRVTKLTETSDGRKYQNNLQKMPNKSLLPRRKGGATTEMTSNIN